MRVIVTRVQPQAARWVQLLSPRFDAVALPLLQTSALPDPSALKNVAEHWSDYAAVMFVSSHAVDFFFKENQALALMYKGRVAPETRVWVTGPGTRATVLAQGVPALRVDSPPETSGQFDSEALWQQVQGQISPGARVLIVRGDLRDDGTPDERLATDALPVSGTPGAGRDWLAQSLQQAGAEVDFVVAYQRGAPVWDQAEQDLARQAAADGSVWLFSSAQAVMHLPTVLPGQSWARARAVATHARIAQAARSLGFAMVAESRATLSDVVASIESLA